MLQHLFEGSALKKSITLYIITILGILFFQPSFLFDEEGNMRCFGLGDKKENLKGHSNTKGELFQTSGFAVSKSSNVGADVLIKKGDDVLQFNNENITLKIDVEGFELFVLKGLEKTLINNCCILQIEIWEKNNEDVQRFLKMLNYKMMCSIDGDTYFSNKLIK